MTTARRGSPLAAERRPWWLGVAVVAIGAVWLYAAAQLPQTARYAEVGPGLFVTLVGAGLVLLGVLLLVQIGRGEQFAPQDAEDALADVPASRPALLTALAAAAVPLLTMRTLGFPLTAAFTFALVTRAFGSRRLVFDFALGLLLGVVCWYGFSLLGVTLGRFLPILAR